MKLYKHKHFFYWLVPQRGKNANWWEAADQLAIYKRSRGDETRDCRVTSTGRELNPGCWIPSPPPWPLGHAASPYKRVFVCCCCCCCCCSFCILFFQVPLSVFWEYIKSLTLVNACCIFTFTLLGESFSITSGIWLAKWSSSNISSSGDRQLFLGVYAALGLAQAFSVFSWAMFFALGAQFASRHLHQRMLVNIMHSPMSFFETTPLGRIVNRFSKDMNGIDQLVPRSVSSSLRTLLNVLASLFSISFATPVFLVVVVPLAVFYIFIQVW